jgi:hypothetical protein
MKKMKIFYATIMLGVMVMMSSCGSLSNMSNEDAYNVGYGLGTLIRNMQ